ncbi:polysaccharide export protein EpsE [Herbaspirillum robiniae]|uniref:Polysaccharide export protein EpsE n=1 Tax=Herbaspirillum robiniae TaxID=2014887 RepID=A0A246WWK1_9BURK|nr:polysaccharide export protein EpsE [Herbaspirillum robiniae]NUU00248.1 polysaccharide export protein EpsE [Herbaspirillum robiniae]OWY31459.1 polysaccharide export protein EpsE [Herbaspirillum robiniae]
MRKILLLLAGLLIAAGLGSSAMAEDIPLGPGDVIRVNVYGSQDLTLETRISEAGVISYPLIGEVKIGGLATSQAERKIADLLKKGGYLVNPQVNILVTTPQSQMVSVLGQVYKPGRYPLDGKRNVADVIALAGGVNPDGGDAVTIVHNENGQVKRTLVDIYAVTHNGDTSELPTVSANDVIYVERSLRFYIYGEVQRPGMYKLERGTTVLQALSVGGGLTLRGTERGLKVKRRDTDGVLQELDVKKDDLLQADDIVYVKESWF